ncbi:MAG: undecaprenyldiphospho-muramoylpentapeptide beta-N-acetylglucosaminyltransferase [Lachnospiraceae bacterium]|jgi:UDP-N-acetylglucosamine--N-acetylmuramyl-(pentapeptide) pyrophosphoryl-undecaprenol N-acetylglucosamine transferase|nr:undecaprenyldiphospho-muramoylpentapeptide beta-N-acetylglucosaminyltransferase [Lachnospiraceae bacterium]
MNPFVMMTGGGTAGHVTPNLALIEPLRQKGYRIGYIGRKNSIEAQLAKEAGLPFYCISAGPLHRDFNMENWVSPWKNMLGVMQAAHIIRREKPDLIFCKGGFVSVPVAVAGQMLHRPVVLHESDFTPGLANRMCLPFADTVCVSFEETMAHMPAGKAVYTGTPVRSELLQGSAEEGYRITGLRRGKPVVLVMGGSSGAGALNRLIGPAAERLTKEYEVVHLCGKQEAQDCVPRPGYFPMKYAKEELSHLYAMADMVVSRAGANALAELLLLGKPHILIPLPKAASRGDQILNAKSFAAKGFSYVLPQEELTEESLSRALREVWSNRRRYTAAMEKSRVSNGTQAVLEVIERTINGS